MKLLVLLLAVLIVVSGCVQQKYRPQEIPYIQYNISTSIGANQYSTEPQKLMSFSCSGKSMNIEIKNLDNQLIEELDIVFIFDGKERMCDQFIFLNSDTAKCIIDLEEGVHTVDVFSKVFESYSGNFGCTGFVPDFQENKE